MYGVQHTRLFWFGAAQTAINIGKHFVDFSVNKTSIDSKMFLICAGFPNEMNKQTGPIKSPVKCA